MLLLTFLLVKYMLLKAKGSAEFICLLIDFIYEFVLDFLASFYRTFIVLQCHPGGLGWYPEQLALGWSGMGTAGPLEINKSSCAALVVNTFCEMGKVRQYWTLSTARHTAIHP